MARWPAPGRCKSRLALDLGARRAATVQQKLLAHSLSVLEQTCQRLGCDGRLALAGAAAGPGRRLAGDVSLSLQRTGCLGVRLQRQAAVGFRQGYRQVVLIGSDLPGLECNDLAEAFAALDRHALVLGPAVDGGYWLVGQSRPAAALFAGIDWGSDQVLQQSLDRAHQLGLSLALLRQQGDLDRVCDLEPWR